jgi:hypothetical protein
MFEGLFQPMHLIVILIIVLATNLFIYADCSYQINTDPVNFISKVNG